jgi:hypothetical protein
MRQKLLIAVMSVVALLAAGIGSVPAKAAPDCYAGGSGCTNGQQCCSGECNCTLAPNSPCQCTF